MNREAAKDAKENSKKDLGVLFILAVEKQTAKEAREKERFAPLASWPVFCSLVNGKGKPGVLSAAKRRIEGAI